MDTAAASFMLGEVARVTVAVLFGLAALHAMRDWAIFAAIVEEYRIAPRRLAIIAAGIIPPAELVVAAALVLPPTSSIGAVLGFCLMVLFTGAININIARGRVSIECGCGGAEGQTLSSGLVVRNLVVIAALTIGCLAPSRGVIDAASVVGTAGASLALVALYFAVGQLMKNSQSVHGLNPRSLS